MDWTFLYFLAEPWFVIPWYAIGALGVCFLVWDMRQNNTPLKPAMKWAWPIIVFFFSVIGLVLYFTTARAPGIGKMKSDEEKQEAHNEYQKNMWRRTNGAVIHCVAGDGLGIMTGMVIARFAGMSFWQEFWFEYLTGYVIGWFIFQRKSMTMMTSSLPKQLAMAFRGEFFSMLTVMSGMGAVMTFITPMVVGAQPKPFTAAFWGFGMLGLLVGFVFTYPMNWMMVKLGWKHGMGGKEGAKKEEVERKPKRGGVLATMSALGLAALLIPAWLTEIREDYPTRDEESSIAPATDADVGHALHEGLGTSIDRALEGLRSADWTLAAQSVDSAHRAADVGTHSAPGAFYHALHAIENARMGLHQGNETRAIRNLEEASHDLKSPDHTRPAPRDLTQYLGALVVDANGAVIGEVYEVSDDSVGIALGGWRDTWGLFDFGYDRHVTLPAKALAYGPPRTIGNTLVFLPTERDTTMALLWR